jgi:hypothetical protein
VFLIRKLLTLLLYCAVFLNQRNLPQLFVTASQYDAENFSQLLSATENEVINAVQSGEKADTERGLANLPGPASSHEAAPQNTAVTHQLTTNSESVTIGRAKSCVSVAVPPVSATVANGLAVSEVLKGEHSSDDDSSSSSDSDSDSESEESNDEGEEQAKVANAVVSADVAVAGSVMLPVQSSVTAAATLEGESSGSDSDDDSSDEETDIPDAVVSKSMNATNATKHMELEAITQDTKVQGIVMQSAALNSGD